MSSKMSAGCYYRNQAKAGHAGRITESMCVYNWNIQIYARYLFNMRTDRSVSFKMVGKIISGGYEI